MGEGNVKGITFYANSYHNWFIFVVVLDLGIFFFAFCLVWNNLINISYF